MTSRSSKQLYITMVEGSTNDERIWKVRLSNNPNIIVKMPASRAKKLVTAKTKYVIENFSAVYRLGKNEAPIVNIKYKGFKIQETTLTSNIQKYIDMRRKQALINKTIIA
jgi:hypothetical protein